MLQQAVRWFAAAGLVLFLVAQAAPLPAIAGQPAVQSRLIGRWKSEDGQLLLELRADYVALLETIAAELTKKTAEQPPDPKIAAKEERVAARTPQATAADKLRIGSYRYRRFAWLLSVSDAADRVTTYAIVSQHANRLSLVNHEGTLIPFSRTR